jgi:uncharacterized lipoprotein YddW (UPF0748 family)
MPLPPAGLPAKPRLLWFAVANLVALALAVSVALAFRSDAGSLPGDAPARADAGERGDRSRTDGDSASGSTGSCGGQPLVATRELRGMWLTTVNNIDWPSKRGLDAETIKSEYRGWLDQAQRLNHNAIFVHAKPSGDALWPSEYAPWSEWLTGVRGQDPGFDVMKFIIDEAHARNLEFHAWFNPYRGSQPASVGGAGPDINALAPDHPLRKHPEWAVVYPVDAAGSRLHYNPGIPQARRFVEDGMLEAVRRYDVDAVHFDDFFYPYPHAGQDFGDDAAYQKYGTGFANKADWRRDNVNTLVREMNERIKEIKPWVKFGISPFGIWRNARTDPLGSDTRGLQAFDDIAADTRLWVKREWLDYIVPQLYWYIGFEIADYGKLLPWWAEVVKGTRVQLYIGQADYRVGEKGVWSDPAELDRQLALNDKHGVHGSVHFSSKSVRNDRLGSVTRYAASHYAAPALLPRMAHLPRKVPGTPTGVTASAESGGVKVAWRTGSGEAAAYAVYKVDAASNGAGAKLVGTVRAAGKQQSWTHKGATGGAGGYCVTALDRSANESAPTPATR